MYCTEFHNHLYFLTMHDRCLGKIFPCSRVNNIFICLTGSDVVAHPITTDFWPPAMSSAIPRIIGLLDDSSVTLSQTAGESITLNLQKQTSDIFSWR